MRVRRAPTYMGFGAARGDTETSPPPPEQVPELRTVVPMQTSFVEGAELVIRWTAPTERSEWDWIGLYAVGAPHTINFNWYRVPPGATAGVMAFPPVPMGGPYEARYFLDGSHTAPAATSPSFRVVAPPVPPPRDIKDLAEEAVARIKAATSIIRLAVGTPPMGDVTELLAWARNLRELRAANPLINDAMSVIEAAYPGEEPSTGFLNALRDVGSTIIDGVAFVGRTIVNAVGAAITFVAGDLPSPDDYAPENLCVTAWLNPPKFALLTAVAAIIFPPALLYMGAYVPPNVVGVTLGLAEAFTRGGTQRVIDKILEPLFNAIEELAEVLLDYAFNGNAALIRWALRKIASRLPEGIVQAITLSLAEAADVVIEALKDIQALKTENFFANIGEAMERVAGQFTGELAMYLQSAGSAIKAAAQAISIVMEKGIDGLLEAVNSLTTMLLGIPADFVSLARSAQVQIAQAKVFGEGGAATAILASVVQGVRSGLEGLFETAKELPFSLGEVIGDALDPISQLVAQIDEFIQNLFMLAAEGQEQGGELPPDEDLPLPDEGGAIPAAGGGMSSILLALAGGLGGAMVAGPLGAAAGAGAGLLLGKKAS